MKSKFFRTRAVCLAPSFLFFAAVLITACRDVTARRELGAGAKTEHTELAAKRPRVEYIFPSGAHRVLGQVQPSSQAVRTLSRATDSLLDTYEPKTRRSSELFALAHALRKASDSGEWSDALRVPLVETTRFESASVDARGGFRRISFYRRGAPEIRITYPAVVESNTGADAAVLSIDCSAYPADTTQDDLPAECAEGYDPNWDPSEVEMLLAALLGEAALIESERASLDGQHEYEVRGPSTQRPFLYAAMTSATVELRRPWSAAGDGCQEARALYFGALAGLAWHGAKTVWYIYRRNPMEALKSLKLSGAAVLAVAVTYGKLVDCLEEEE